MEEMKNNQEPIQLPYEPENEQEESSFVPSPRWKRVFAWVLFVIVTLAVLSWLAGIAWPEVWPGKAAEWMRSLF